MTEDDAKIKWCPFARAPVFADQSYPVNEHISAASKIPVTANRLEGTRAPGDPDCIPITAHCLGSACMMWEPTQFEHEDAVTGRCGLVNP